MVLWPYYLSTHIPKVYIPAIEGYVPEDMVRTLRAFLEFCYLARRDVLDSRSLADLEHALTRFHTYREIFVTTGIRNANSIPPRQHSMRHYKNLIRDFGAPNGLCSSITESKHIKAVKEPWRRSNRYNALEQMLRTNQRLDKLAAARVDFVAQGILTGSLVQEKNGRETQNDSKSGGVDPYDESTDIPGKTTRPSITLGMRATSKCQFTVFTNRKFNLSFTKPPGSQHHALSRKETISYCCVNILSNDSRRAQI
jgi:hypothetical protein